jgi:hypothetical protein
VSTLRAVSREFAEAPLQAPYGNHGGLTPAALFGVRLCIAKVVFSPADVRTPTRERGALAPRGMFSECEPDYGNPAHCRCRRGLQPHGGLTPAALGRGFANRQTMFEFRGRASGSPSHGGLTVAALVSARDECPRTCGVSVLQVRFPNRGGLTFAAAGNDDRRSRWNRFPLQMRGGDDSERMASG